MSSLVSDFIINPVLRQARRFSEISRATLIGDYDEAGTRDSAQHVAVIDPDPVEEAMAGPLVTPASPESRPLSSSTQETRVDEASTGPAVVGTMAIDHLGFPISPPRTGREIPADDGMRTLRGRIHEINSRNIPASDKARLMHDILLEGYRLSSKEVPISSVSQEAEGLGQTWEHATSPGPLDSFKFWQNQMREAPDLGRFILRESDIAPTFAPIRHPKSASHELSSSAPPTPPDAQRPFGCSHYERNVKIECSTCKKWYTCVFCHDEKEDHNLVRKETKHMLCMHCATPQKAADTCYSCGQTAAKYYCGICKLWENRANKPIYHCDDCGICRRGFGLGKDFFHCKTCRACITTSIESSHKCIERSTDCDCPICGEYMFTSPKPVVFMKCGHSIHKKCYDAHMKVSYKCPLCSKSLANMESQFRNLDLVIHTQPMPTEFKDTKAIILCNDCSARSTVPYHWLGLKCSICRSYNTAQIQLLGRDNQEIAAGSPGAATSTEQPPSRPPMRETRTAAAPPRSRVGSLLTNRRRHSSHGVELQHQIQLDRYARSLSPVPVEGSILGRIAAESEDEDENDMFGFWRRSGDESSSSDDGDEMDEENSDMEGSEDQAEGEEDEEDEISLIGHR